MRGFFDPRQLDHAPTQELHNGGFAAYAEVPARARAILAAVDGSSPRSIMAIAPILRGPRRRLPRTSCRPRTPCGSGGPAGRCDPLCLAGGRATSAPARSDRRTDRPLQLRRHHADHCATWDCGVRQCAGGAVRARCGAGWRAIGVRAVPPARSPCRGRLSRRLLLPQQRGDRGAGGARRTASRGSRSSTSTITTATARRTSSGRAATCSTPRPCRSGDRLSVLLGPCRREWAKAGRGHDAEPAAAARHALDPSARAQAHALGAIAWFARRPAGGQLRRRHLGRRPDQPLRAADRGLRSARR